MYEGKPIRVKFYWTIWSFLSDWHFQKNNKKKIPQTPHKQKNPPPHHPSAHNQNRRTNQKTTHTKPQNIAGSIHKRYISVQNLEYTVF